MSVRGNPEYLGNRGRLAPLRHEPEAGIRSGQNTAGGSQPIGREAYFAEAPPLEDALDFAPNRLPARPPGAAASNPAG